MMEKKEQISYNHYFTGIEMSEAAGWNEQFKCNHPLARHKKIIEQYILATSRLTYFNYELPRN